MIRKNGCMQNTKRHKGMTLIELLIVVAIIGVLAAITYPSYQEHVLKGHRSSAMADMLKIQIEMELSKSKIGAYNSATIVSGGSCDFCDTDSERYTFSVTESSATNMEAYTIKAVPRKNSPQIKDKCGTLSLNAGSVGTANKAGVAVDGCW
ncbi:type IV pilin protein [Vibrio algicola]|uniref:Prepilin-type N-terminal cleavage/methylation domain-containing protein n=1 Tax=Vibrio algicola TaxID=2662262 RepID=A0A5Q0TDK2_9VIBR|nr:type IV pilin protein [Vibrio algicola]